MCIFQNAQMHYIPIQQSKIRKVYFNDRHIIKIQFLTINHTGNNLSP